MSNATENPATSTAGRASTGLTTGQLLQALRDNFAAISGAIVAAGVILATTFLTAYLSTFDWHLLWFVQYTDIITFGLLALGIISGSFVVLQASTQAVVGVFGLDKLSQRRWMWSGGLLVLALLIFLIWGSVHQGQGYFHVIWGFIAIALGIIVIIQVIGYAKSGTLPNVVQFTFLSILIISSAGGLGQWLGYSVLESGELQDIKIKDTTLNGVKLIIVMSRHTIFLKDRDIYVVPTADISQFHSVAPFGMF